MTHDVKVVDPAHVLIIWDKVRPFLEAAIDLGEGPADYNIHHVQAYVTSGQWLLLVAVGAGGEICGAMAVSFINYPLNRVAFVTAVGGSGIVCADGFAQVRAVLQQHGATKIQCYARPAVQRLYRRQKLGFAVGSNLLEVQI